MKHQKQICVKLNFCTYDKLQLEKERSGTAANKIINISIEHYIDYLDERRRSSCIYLGNSSSDDNDAKELGKYILSSMTVGQMKELYFIARGLGTDEKNLMMKAITFFIENYHKKPFNFV